MKRLLIDASSVIKAALYAANKGPNAYLSEFEGGQEVIPSHLDGFEVWLGSLTKTLTDLKMVPSQIVLVKDGANASERRRVFLPEYRVRKPRPPEFLQEFFKLQEKVEKNLLSYGAISVSKQGVEADDMIAALAKVTDSMIWSIDGDLLAAGHLYCRGEIDPNRFLGIQKKHIVVYKSLIGDQVDGVPGAKGFGETAFLKMIEQFGEDCLDEFLEMLENKTLSDLAGYVDDFKPFQKILDNEEQVYASYQCAKFHHPGWKNIEWKAEYPKGDGTFPQWDLKVQLITKKDLTREFMAKMKKQFAECPWGPSYDIETWSDEESLEWGVRNKGTRGPRLDVYGAHMAGFSITSGPNNNLVYYFPVDHKDTDNISVTDMRDLLNLCHELKPMFVFNAEFELPVTRNHMELRFDRGWLPNVMDVLIMKSYVDENTPLQLKLSSMKYLGYRQVTYEEITGQEIPEKPEQKFDGEVWEEEEVDDSEPVPRVQMNELTGEQVVAYGADDSVCTGALANLFSLIMLYEETWMAFWQCEREPAYLCAESFLNGQKFDLDRLAELTVENEKKSAEIWEKISDRLVKLEWKMGDPLSGAEWTERWPGCEFIPAASLAASELKAVYYQITGEALKSNFRSVDKLAKAMEPKAPELAAALFAPDPEDPDGALLPVENVGPFNFAAEALFKPRPELNLGSPKQLQFLLYNAMNFPVRLRGKVTQKMRDKGITTGNPKGNESAIRHAIMHDATEEQKELLLMLIEAKGYQTDRSLYLKPYVEMPNPKSGLVHGSYGQSRQKSRRWSSSGPNKSQLSHKSPIREVYVPMFEDHMIVSFDEAGQELRHCAWHSQDAAMLSCFIGDNLKDIHSITGRAIMALKGQDVSYEDFMAMLKGGDEEQAKVVAKHRKNAKPCNFLDLYGGTAASLAEQLLIPVAEAEAIMSAKHEAFPDVVVWQNRMEAIHREREYALTPMGARKHLILDGSWKDNHELRSALNSIIQGGAAEQIKRAMVKFWLKRITDRFDCVYLFPCHDEHIWSCNYRQIVEFCREVHAIMVEPYGGMDIPWESSIEIGWNYGQMKEFSGFDAEAIQAHVNKLLEERKCQ